MSISVPPLPGTTLDPLYPDSDGEPVGETEFHFVALWHLYGALSQWYRMRDDVHVAGNMLLYYEKGNPSAVRGPDVMVSKGVRGKHFRRSFRTWEEGTVPSVIFEITSLKTREEDQGPKPLVYAQLGVNEYFMFDAEGEYLQPSLQGFRLDSGKYVGMPDDGSGRLVSRELGLELAVEDYLLRLTDPSSGQPPLTAQEYAEQLAEAQRRAAEASRDAKRGIQKAQREAKAERQRAAKLEAELARLRARLPPESSTD